MLSKKDMLARLREHPLYRSALASVDAEQSKRIASIVEGFLAQAAEGLIPMIAQVSDPTKLSEVQQALREDGRVVNIDPATSGSKGS